MVLDEFKYPEVPGNPYCRLTGMRSEFGCVGRLALKG
jgi:hypothetical protein